MSKNSTQGVSAIWIKPVNFCNCSVIPKSYFTDCVVICNKQCNQKSRGSNKVTYIKISHSWHFESISFHRVVIFIHLHLIYSLPFRCLQAHISVLWYLPLSSSGLSKRWLHSVFGEIWMASKSSSTWVCRLSLKMFTMIYGLLWLLRLDCTNVQICC